MDYILLIFTIFSILITSIYLYIKYRFDYWKRKNVQFIVPEFPYGNIKEFGKTAHSSQHLQKFYQQLKGRGELFGGIFFFIRPVLLPIDLDFMKNILIKDFNYFIDRGSFTNEKYDPLSENFSRQTGEKWRILRAKLTPTFTSGKMRLMFPIVENVANELDRCVASLIRNGNENLNVRSIISRYTTDVIGTCAFGIDCNTLKDGESEFMRMGKKSLESPRNSTVKMFFMFSFKRIAQMMRMKMYHDDVTDFFMTIIRDTVKYREDNNIQRNDYLDLLIQLKNQGKLLDDNSKPISQEKLTINEVAAQCFIFIRAGFETSSSMLSYCLYELALNKDIKKKAKVEINSVLKKHDGHLSYASLMDMVYLEQILNETLRKYPPITSVTRVSVKDYPVPNTNIVIDKDTMVMFPVYAIHHDPDVYPEPEKFDPDRFAAGENQHPTAFLSFGAGPRLCIGIRFTMMMARIALVTLLTKYDFDICNRTDIPLKFEKSHQTLSPTGGIWLNVKKL